MKEFFLLDPKIIFLNHGSFGATPRAVLNTYQRWQIELENEPVAFLGRKVSDFLAGSRETLSRYLGTQRDNLVYTTNVTVALNIIGRSLPLGPGDEVLATNMEYGAMDRTWRFLSGKQGFKYITQPVRLPFSQEGFLTDLQAGVTPRTRLIFLSHITSPTAMIFPVRQVCEMARSRRILTVIDGAHAPGQIEVNLDEIGADFYGGNLHKWLCAPKGAGFLYASPLAQHLVEPLTVSWGWQSEFPGPSQFVDLLEWNGTRDVSAFLSVPDAISFQAEHNWPEIRTRCHEYVSTCLSDLTSLTGLPSLYENGNGYAQMAAGLLPPECDLPALQALLFNDFHIEVPLISWNNQKIIRISLQAYNDPEDIFALQTALSELLPLIRRIHA